MIVRMSQADLLKTDSIHTDIEFQHTIANLTGRWNDEKEFEDINDYKAVLQKVLDKFDVSIIKMHKRPFGCTVLINGFEIAYTCTMRGRLNWKRIK